VLLIGNTLYLHYFLCELGVSGSIGKTLSSLLMLELATLQVCSLKYSFFCIGWDLAPKGLKQSFGWVRIIDQLSGILMQQSRQVLEFSFDFYR